MEIAKYLSVVALICTCQAGELYYVRPVGSTNTTCYGHTCLLFSEYVNKSSFYFKSNTVFKLLYGAHESNQTVMIQEVTNILLEGEQTEKDSLTQININIDCFQSECTGLVLHKISSLTLRSLNLSVYVDNPISSLSQPHEGKKWRGIKCTKTIFLQFENFDLQVMSSDTAVPSFGIYVFDSCSVTIHSLQATCENTTTAIHIESSEMISIENVTIVYGAVGLSINTSYTVTIYESQVISTSSGIFIGGSFAADIDISNVKVEKSKKMGIHIEATANVTISDTVVLYAEENAIFLTGHSFDIRIVNTTVIGAGMYGSRIMPHSMLLPYLHYTCNDTTVIRPAVHATTVIIDNTRVYGLLCTPQLSSLTSLTTLRCYNTTRDDDRTIVKTKMSWGQTYCYIKGKEANLPQGKKPAVKTQILNRENLLGKTRQQQTTASSTLPHTTPNKKFPIFNIVQSPPHGTSSEPEPSSGETLRETTDTHGGGGGVH